MCLFQLYNCIYKLEAQHEMKFIDVPSGSEWFLISAALEAYHNCMYIIHSITVMCMPSKVSPITGTQLVVQKLTQASKNEIIKC